METKSNNQPKKALQISKRVIASRMTSNAVNSKVGAGRTTTDLYTSAD